MQRPASVAVGLLVVVVVVAAVILAKRPAKTQPKAKKAVATASVSKASAPPPAASAAAEAEDAGAPLSGDGWDTFPDGGKVPELPATAPKQVGFGVVVYAYQNAQFAPKDARSKEQAREKALAVIELAKHDFSAAVGKGDKGSTTDAGRIPRGVLEAPIEYYIFGLEKGQVYPEPIDTPRGYWVVRRND
jgi:hypothetical protein